MKFVNKQKFSYLLIILIITVCVLSPFTESRKKDKDKKKNKENEKKNKKSRNTDKDDLLKPIKIKRHEPKMAIAPQLKPVGIGSHNPLPQPQLKPEFRNVKLAQSPKFEPVKIAKAPVLKPLGTQRGRQHNPHVIHRDEHQLKPLKAPEPKRYTGARRLPRDVRAHEPIELTRRPPRDLRAPEPKRYTGARRLPRDLKAPEPKRYTGARRLPRDVRAPEPRELTRRPPRDLRAHEPKRYTGARRPPRDVRAPEPKQLTRTPPRDLRAREPKQLTRTPPRDLRAREPKQLTRTPPRDLRAREPKQLTRTPTPLREKMPEMKPLPIMKLGPARTSQPQKNEINAGKLNDVCSNSMMNKRGCQKGLECKESDKKGIFTCQKIPLKEGQICQKTNPDWKGICAPGLVCRPKVDNRGMAQLVSVCQKSNKQPMKNMA